MGLVRSGASPFPVIGFVLLHRVFRATVQKEAWVLEAWVSRCWSGKLMSMLDCAGLCSPPPHSALLSALGDLVSAEAAFCLSQPHSHPSNAEAKGRARGEPSPSHHTLPGAQGAGDLSDGGPSSGLGVTLALCTSLCGL